ncbi:acyl-CoA synthetase [Kytococcus sedentarius]|uniref:acyl-CoA synthetase n=1 Tax=Kytococcus sedentarius TaxID=1276 RepID=UPI00194ED731|nr:AMP-binding protein [Kytococcus sedentarius]QRO87782.1 AMP-binding protein [Kytococcus sedentarius]
MAEHLTQWAELARALPWRRQPDCLWEPGPRGGSWVPGSLVSLSDAVLQRGMGANPDQLVVHWEGEPGDRLSLTRGELTTRVDSLARALRGLDVEPQDTVALHLTLLPEFVIAMLAVAEVGAQWTVLPATLPAEALAQRLEEVGARVVFTQDGAWRHGTVLPLKARVDDALTSAPSVEHTVVVRRTGMDVAWFEGDHWFSDLETPRRRSPRVDRQHSGAEPAPESVATGPLTPVLAVPLATRGGVTVHTHHSAPALLLSATAVHRRLRSGEVSWCAGDAAWAVTQVHGIIGPLTAGDAIVLYEGTLDVPGPHRTAEVARRHGVSTLLTSTAVARSLRRLHHGRDPVGRMASLRTIALAGDAVEPDLARWLGEHLTEGDDQVLDCWGQLELSGIVRITPVPGVGVQQVETAPMPDAGLQVVDDAGEPVPPGTTGAVVMRNPWPGAIVRSTCGSRAGGGETGLEERRWEQWPDVYSTGDLGSRDLCGGITFLGRSDDVVQMSGQLVSLDEVRSELSDHPWVHRAVVTWRLDPALGRVLVAAIVLDRSVPAGTDADVVATAVGDAVREAMGGIARPRSVLLLDRIGDELPEQEVARALRALVPDDGRAAHAITWSQVRAAAGEV